jgi:predicted GNAT family acetyltransferase
MEIATNKAAGQFELHVDGELAILIYRIHKGKLFLMHTEVPESLEGHGYGSALAEYAFQYAAQNALPVVVYCPFVKAWLGKHPEVLKLLSDE